MSRDQDKLFTTGDLSNLATAIHDMVSREVESISKDQLLATPEDDLVQHVVASLQIEPLTLFCDDQMRSSQTETQVDVAGYPGRDTWREGPYMVAGIRIEITIPFTGDKQLFAIQPQGFYMSPRPRGQVISTGDNVGAVLMIFEFPTEENEDRIKELRCTPSVGQFSVNS